eukprot:TRINITY_DN496_c1_g5_i1.p1 TRINITY_DN496_c1_g5~~TRINITY_DN496_c1_g5_i1.p1  ORF type:complete len:181 (-),score=30.59 TRINITY_DN496_c1_g5_i1:672-1214(-)
MVTADPLNENWFRPVIRFFSDRWRAAIAGAILIFAAIYAFRGNSAAASIERVLEQDAIAYQSSTAVEQYVGRLKTIDTLDCPRDFKVGFLAHVQAWEQVAAIEKRTIKFSEDANSTSTMVESFFRGMLGDFSGKFNEMTLAQNQLKAEYDSAALEVRQTWNQVEKLAVSHGAKLRLQKSQ